MEKQIEFPVPLSSDECGQSGGEPDSDEDVITDYYIPTLEMLPRPGPLPTISVTPHSPASKIYPVLEDSLQQVRELHENVQQMRNFSIQKQQHNQQPNSYLKDIKNLGLNPLLAQVARLCTSCPTLNEVASNIDVLTGGCSLESSPLQQPPSMRKGSTTGMQDWLCQPETQRRRSWTALEDLTGNKEKLKHPNRQRSMSLSSMESEADESSLIDNVDGSTVRLLGPETPVIVRHRGTRSSGGAVSTHSLNEADLQNDFNKIKAKREAEQLRLLPQRLPLQKSISTPSIIAARDLASETVLGGAQPTLPLGRPSGTESETEEEGSRSSQVRYDHQSPLHMQYTSYDRHSEKRRKRGSLFFRKKKDKNKKNSHQWVSACYGTSQICDVCNKNLSNKPALYCENCGTSVHQHTCKDSIIECYKPKSYKTSTKISGFTVPLTSSKSSLSKRGSSSLGNSQISSSNSQIIYDEKDSDSYHGHHDSTSFPDDVPLVPLEFLSDSPLAATDLCTDLSLGLHENEPDSWTPYAGKDIARKLKEKEVKRQEHIYEFILTEKHHCITLLVMQKIFVEGLQKYFQMGPSWERMFPRLTDLTELHLNLLARLRQRQRENYIVESIADILLEQFSNEYSNKLKSAYGEFCSRHRDAVEMYKNYLQNDARFAQFVRHCQTNPLLKKKGIPECILFVTQRLTKYPLLIEPLIKTSKDNKYEQDILQKALAKVKEILIEVDAQVAEKEKEDRKLEIYNKIDPKSSTFHKEHKFKKSDILHGNRSLKFEGSAMLMQGRKEVLVIVLTDVIFFLLENSNKYPYIFYTPDNKAGVISLQKLLVREKAGQDNRGIYLISPNPDDPEMFELKVTKPKDRQIWIHAIREAVQTCPEDEEDSIALSSEEKQILLNAKQTQIRHIVGLLRQKDVEQALLLEEKMSLQLKLLSTAGLDPPSPPSYRHLVSENVDTSQMWKEVLTAVQEVSHLASSLYTTGTNLSRSVSSAGEHQSDTYVSPILPKRAETFGGFDNSNQGPFKLLGKKLNTPNSSGNGTPEMDNLKPGDSRLFERLPYRNCVITNGTVEQNQQLQQQQQQQLPTPDAPALLSLGREQQYAAIQLSHYVYTLLCIISQLMTTNESLQAQLQTLKAGESSKQYKHNQQLEELRNLQDKLSGEKTAWAASRDQESKELEEKRSELLRLQEQIRIEQNDIKQQRDQLYRKMEILTNQGLLISPNVALPVTGQLDENYGKDNTDDNCQLIDNNISTTTTTPTISASSTSSTSNTLSSTIERRKESKWNNKTPNQKAHLPINLISTTNQQKVSQVPIKQQIPLKLVSRLSSGTLTNTTITSSSSSSPSPSPSSQATLPGPAQMLPLKLVQDDKFRQKKFKPPSSSGLPIAGASSSSVSAAANNNNNNNNNNSNNTAGTNEEEVIYF